MTPTIFAEWFEDLYRVPKNKIGKTLLLVDNVTSHSVTKVMSNLTVKFLPPDLTYEVQPLDQRTIREVKLQYHWQMLWYIVTVTETNNINLILTNNYQCYKQFDG
jgi:hypothetical protein